MATIRVIDEAEASGRLKEIYDSVRKARGSVADIIKVHSLLPETMQTHLDFYLAIQFGKKGPEGLGRVERELIAVVVSAANSCAYCVAHHADALDKYWKDRARVDRVAKDYHAADLTPGEVALCDFAVKLTRHAGGFDARDVDALRAAGYGDEAILQAILTTSYFNFVNRVANATGIDPAADAAKPYNY